MTRIQAHVGYADKYGYETIWFETEQPVTPSTAIQVVKKEAKKLPKGMFDANRCVIVKVEESSSEKTD